MARGRPDALFDADGSTLTYAELGRRGDRIPHALPAEGVSAGDSKIGKVGLNRLAEQLLAGTLDELPEPAGQEARA